MPVYSIPKTWKISHDVSCQKINIKTKVDLSADSTFGLISSMCSGLGQFFLLLIFVKRFTSWSKRLVVVHVTALNG